MCQDHLALRRGAHSTLIASQQAGGKKKKKQKAAADADTNGSAGAEGAVGALRVESYAPADPGPYPEDLPPQNPVRFTPVQVEAVKSGVQPGLTLVVGPPGASPPPKPSPFPFQPPRPSTLPAPGLASQMVI